MKITAEHIARIRAAIEPLDTPERRAQYIAGEFRNADLCRNVALRYRWDLLYAAGLNQWIGSTVYPYANDDHIDTAVRFILGMDHRSELKATGE